MCLERCWITEVILTCCYSATDFAYELCIFDEASYRVYIICVCPDLAQVLLMSNMRQLNHSYTPVCIYEIPYAIKCSFKMILGN
jgi:hypothetical protein